MAVLDRIGSPADVKALKSEDDGESGEAGPEGETPAEEEEGEE